MKIQNLAGILGARVENNPQISEISGFCFEAEKVRSGECFFAKNELSACLAAKNGAYAIIGDIAPFDDEVAFIKTADLDGAILRLVRYFIASKDLKLAFASKIQMALLDCISGDFVLLKNDIQSIFHSAQKAKNGDILFLENLEFYKNISFDFKILENSRIPQNAQKSLFYSDFVFDDMKYSIELCPLFLGEMMGILEFLSKENIAFKLRDFREFKYFKVLFVSAKNEPISASNRAFICVNDEEIFEYLKDKIEAVFCYNFKSFDELKALKFSKYAVVFCEFDELKAALKTSENEESLF